VLKLFLFILLILPTASGQDIGDVCSTGDCPTDPDTGEIKCPNRNLPDPAERFSIDLVAVPMPVIAFESLMDYTDLIKLNNSTLLMNISFNNSTLANFTPTSSSYDFS